MNMDGWQGIVRTIMAMAAGVITTTGVISPDAMHFVLTTLGGLMGAGVGIWSLTHKDAQSRLFAAQLEAAVTAAIADAEKAVAMAPPPAVVVAPVAVPVVAAPAPTA